MLAMLIQGYVTPEIICDILINTTLSEINTQSMYLLGKHFVWGKYSMIAELNDWMLQF